MINKSDIEDNTFSIEVFKGTPFYNYYKKINSENITVHNGFYKEFDLTYPSDVNFVQSNLIFEIMKAGWPSFILYAFQPEDDYFYSLVSDDLSDSYVSKTDLIEERINLSFQNRRFVRDYILARLPGYDEYSYLDSIEGDQGAWDEIVSELNVIKKDWLKTYIDQISSLVSAKTKLTSYDPQLKYLGSCKNAVNNYHYPVLPKNDPISNKIDIRECIQYCSGECLDTIYLTRSLEKYYNYDELDKITSKYEDNGLFMPKSTSLFAYFINEWIELNEKRYPDYSSTCEVMKIYSKGYFEYLEREYDSFRQNLYNEDRVSLFLTKLLNNPVAGWFKDNEHFETFILYSTNFENAIKWMLGFYDFSQNLLEILRSTLFIREMELVIDEIKMELRTRFDKKDTIFNSAPSWVVNNLNNDVLEPISFETILWFIGIEPVGVYYSSWQEEQIKNRSTLSSKFDRFQTESVLHKQGYWVGLSKGKSKSERQKILKKVIDQNILTKNEVVKIIKRNIDNFCFREQYSIAVAEWQDDLFWIQNNF